MILGHTSVDQFLIEEERRNPALTGDLSILVSDVMRACKAVAQQVSLGALAALAGRSGDPEKPDLQEDAPKPLDLLSSRIFRQHCAWGGHLAAMSSSGEEAIYTIPGAGQSGNYRLVLDPLDGSSNIDVNLTVGSIFSVLRCPDHCCTPTAADFLQPGSAQIAAGYALYGPSTMLVLTLGNGTHGFTLDREMGEFLLTHPNLQIPAETCNFSVNASNERFWEPPIRRYIGECLDGKTGVRGKDFNMRWVAAMVADVHRILLRGGVFMYPQDTRDVRQPGRLGLLHKVNPLAMIVEQAGGRASTGYERIGDVLPGSLQQQVPVILGSRDEVERIERYHSDYLKGEDKPFSSPLFATRSLFRVN